MRGKIIDLFDVSWGKIAILEFPEPAHLKLGDELRDESNNLYKVTGVSNSKAPIVEKYKHMIDSNHVLDCTIKPIGHHNMPEVNDFLLVVKSQ